MAGFEWYSGIAAVGNWKPDFKVTFPCGHSECSGSHTILVSVLPVDDISEMQGHPALEYRYLVQDLHGKYLADAGALFGSSPAITKWEMAHGAGGGIEDIHRWTDDADQLWRKAGEALRLSV